MCPVHPHPERVFCRCISHSCQAQFWKPAYGRNPGNTTQEFYGPTITGGRCTNLVCFPSSYNKFLRNDRVQTGWCRSLQPQWLVRPGVSSSQTTAWRLWARSPYCSGNRFPHYAHGVLLFPAGQAYLNHQRSSFWLHIDPGFYMRPRYRSS